MPLAYHTSISANPDPTISLAFIEANYKVLESLLRERTRQMRNEGLRIEFEYYSKEYEEEIEMEPRPVGSGLWATLGYLSHAQGGNSSLEGTSTYYPYGGFSPQAPMSNHVPAHNGFMYPSNDPPNSYSFYTQPINPLPNAPAYLNHGPTGLFIDFTGYMTLFVRWIENYPLPDGLKMPSHVVS
ncbi:hypothetical protein Tco_1030762 [Tanacetum coccineum]|uniref:Uncharacterized protein n=1 Tax=Tanacetum coccineum TaxID=301880 RepID=A0ABQ5G749_9ASTR